MPATSLPKTVSTIEDALSKSDIATLSHTAIAKLTPAEMLRVIAIADLPFARETSLSFQSEDTLRQLTHLACQCCRNQGH